MLDTIKKRFNTDNQIEGVLAESVALETERRVLVLKAARLLQKVENKEGILPNQETAQLVKWLTDMLDANANREGFAQTNSRYHRLRQ